MIFADKIIALRKKSGWSQEELAEKMHVTRQSVSKWEGAQSIPDLDKILQLSQIFGVSTDYLLKDEMEEAEYASGGDAETPAVRRVSLEEANEFLAVKALTARHIAWATFLCILSPICLLLLVAACETGTLAISENAACGLGIIIMVLMAAGAVALFITSGMKTSRFEYLGKEVFETEYGVSGMVKERQGQFRETYARYHVLGACICILSVIPLFAGVFFGENTLLCVILLCCMFLLAGIGVRFFILAGIPWASMQMLLQEGDYTRQQKRNGLPLGVISTVYWMVVTAGYLVYCFITEDWKNSWVIWPVAGVLFGAVMAACSVYQKKRVSGEDPRGSR